MPDPTWLDLFKRYGLVGGAFVILLVFQIMFFTGAVETPILTAARKVPDLDRKLDQVIASVDTRFDDLTARLTAEKEATKAFQTEMLSRSGETNGKLTSMLLGQNEQARLLRAICRNTAKTDLGRENCDR